MHRSISNRWFLIGLALWISTSHTRGQGSIVYHNPEDVRIISPGGVQYRHEIDMNGDGSNDYVFEAYDNFKIFSRNGNRSIAIPKGGLDSGSWSVPLEDGFSIHGELPEPMQWETSIESDFFPDLWVGQTLHLRNSLGSIGYWNPSESGSLTAFVGVEFAIEESLHYGWIRVSVGPAGNGGIIRDWAYNAVPGEAILAGQIPEPSTFALIALGGVFLLYRLIRPK